MRHPDRFDLPKGHMKTGETEMECAFREVFEETGISQSQLIIEHGFRYTNTYYPRYKRFGGEQVEKTIVIFLAWVDGEVTVQPEEHFSYEWVKWNPPYKNHKKTINPLLRQVDQFWSMTTDGEI
jgi:8-oxo-dGTP pyrophosphatase MutT (NUDIX family)